MTDPVAMFELQRRVEALEKKVQNLEREVQNLKAEKTKPKEPERLRN